MKAFGELQMAKHTPARGCLGQGDLSSKQSATLTVQYCIYCTAMNCSGTQAHPDSVTQPPKLRAKQRPTTTAHNFPVFARLLHAMKVVCAFAVLLSCADIVLANQLRHRHLQTYYNVVADLGSEDKQVTRANPLKGLLSSIESQFDEAFFPSSLEFYAFKLDSIMIGEDEYDWSELDASLEAAQARHRHVVWRVIDNEQVNYNDSNFLSSIRAFIYTMGTRYDGQKSVGFIQLGLLGRSGQWREEDITSSTKDSVVSWYAEAFPETQLQVPVALPLAANVGMGMHYDSFGDKTIGVESSAGYEEREGLVVIEAESPTNGVVGPWKLESDVSGYTGAGYIRMDGNTVQGGSVNGILNYPFRINTPGNYRISLRTNKNNPDDTWSNDCYVKLLDSAGHAVEPTHDWYVALDIFFRISPNPAGFYTGRKHTCLARPMCGRLPRG